MLSEDYLQPEVPLGERLEEELAVLERSPGDLPPAHEILASTLASVLLGRDLAEPRAWLARARPSAQPGAEHIEYFARVALELTAAVIGERSDQEPSLAHEVAEQARQSVGRTPGLVEAFLSTQLARAAMVGAATDELQLQRCRMGEPSGDATPMLALLVALRADALTRPEAGRLAALACHAAILQGDESTMPAAAAVLVFARRFELPPLDLLRIGMDLLSEGLDSSNLRIERGAPRRAKGEVVLDFWVHHRGSGSPPSEFLVSAFTHRTPHDPFMQGDHDVAVRIRAARGCAPVETPSVAAEALVSAAARWSTLYTGNPNVRLRLVGR